MCNIQEPEQIKETLATLKWRDSTKSSVAQICDAYINYIGKTWERPKYNKAYGIPFIPTEQEIDSLISAGTAKTATLLQLLKETGARIGEVAKIEWIDIDFERRAITINKPEKRSNARILPMSVKLSAMLNNLPKKGDKVFQTTKHGLRTTFETLRGRTAIKLNNTRLNKIHLHTFRHWKGTIEYHKTKDIIHVMKILGHKSIRSTMTYINIEQALYLADSDEWVCKTAITIKEATELIETGFTYITDMEGIKLFRKRK